MHHARPMYMPTDPLRDAIRLVSGGREPPDYVRGWDVSALGEENTDNLQRWLAAWTDQSHAPAGGAELARHRMLLTLARAMQAELTPSAYLERVLPK